MLTIPVFEDRDAQPYAFIKFTVPMNEMQKPADQGFPALFKWLAQNGVTTIGAPFYNYRRINMAETLDVEAGVMVERSAEGDGTVQFGELPAGRFVRLTNIGHFDELFDVTTMLIGWAKQRGVQWDVTEAADGDHFACRLEIYETDPSEEPDPKKWETTLLFKTSDQAIS